MDFRSASLEAKRRSMEIGVPHQVQRLEHGGFEVVCLGIDKPVFVGSLHGRGPSGWLSPAEYQRFLHRKAIGLY